jgi:hypothetical protein
LEDRWCPSFSLVTSRAALASADSVNWGTLGPQWTVASNPFTILSTSGHSITVSKTVADSFRTVVEKGPGYPSGAWIGNFAPGDAVLWTFDTGTSSRNPINMNFGPTPVAAGGAQIDLDIATGASIKFTAEVDAYDASGNLLASFTEKGVATTAEDNSAIFIGISSSSANIFQIALSIKDSSKVEKGDFAINQFDFRTSAVAPAAQAVRQPASALDLAPLASSLLVTGPLTVPANSPLQLRTPPAAEPSPTVGQEYVATAGTLIFAPREKTKTITIVVNADSKKEADETFYLDLFGNSSNSLFTKSRGVGTILNDD